jgi:hypothetical protein
VPAVQAAQQAAAIQAAKFSMPAQLKIATLAPAAKFSMPGKMAGLNSALADAAKFSMPGKMAGLNSALADAAKFSILYFERVMDLAACEEISADEVERILIKLKLRDPIPDDASGPTPSEIRV